MFFIYRETQDSDVCIFLTRVPSARVEPPGMALASRRQGSGLCKAFDDDGDKIQKK